MPQQDAPLDPGESPPSVEAAERQDEVGEVHLMYSIVGAQDAVPVYELARTLEALGNVIEEGDHVLHPDRHQIIVRVKPFQEGSFLMDLVLSVQNNPTVLFFLAQPEAVARIKDVLEYLGLIKKAREAIKTVLEVIEFLRNGKAQKIEPAGENTFNYYNEAGQMMPVSQPIHQLVNNGTIQQFFYPAVGAPLQRTPVEAVQTFLKDEPEDTAVRIPKEAASALKAYSEPEPEPEKEQLVENVTTEFLNPKAGTYGDTEGTWTFTLAGSRKNPFHARIADEKFLARFGRGAIRFYHDDLLKVKLRTMQHLKDGRGKITREIIEVLEYTKARVQRARKSKQ